MQPELSKACPGAPERSSTEAVADRLTSDSKLVFGPRHWMIRVPASPSEHEVPKAEPCPRADCCMRHHASRFRNACARGHDARPPHSSSPAAPDDQPLDASSCPPPPWSCCLWAARTHPDRTTSRVKISTCPANRELAIHMTKL